MASSSAAPARGVCAALRVRGMLDEGAIERALSRLAQRATSGAVGLERVDAVDVHAARRAISNATRELGERRWRAILLRIAPRDSILAIATRDDVDERSLHVLLSDLVRRSETPTTPEEARAPKEIEADVAYFVERLRDVVDLEMPTDRPRRRDPELATRRHHARMAPELGERLTAFAREARTTPSAVMLATLAAFSFRHAGTSRFALAATSMRSSAADRDPILALFSDAVAIDFDFRKRTTIRELVQHTRATLNAAFEHGAAPYARVVDAVVRDRDPSRAPLCPVAFAGRAPDAFVALGDVRVEPFVVDGELASCDLTLCASDHEGSVDLVFEYATGLFDPSTVERFAERYLVLLDAALARPEALVDELPIMSERERRTVVVDWNATFAPYPEDRAIHSLFAERARKTPEAIALVCEGKTMTYGALDTASSRVAYRLREAGMQREDPVGIASTRSLEMIVGLLGILKAGCAYVPLDPALPEERLALLCNEARVGIALDPQGELRLPSSARTRRPGELAAAGDGATTECDGSTAAYVLFTSGSTGTPKGVRVEHRPVVRLVVDVDWATFASNDVFLCYAPLAFDASTLEIWAPLLNGAKLVIAPPGVQSVDELADLVRTEGVTFLWLTAGLFHMFVDHALGALRGVRQLFAGGDVLSPPHVRRVRQELPDVALVNGYGPTENTTFTTCHAIESVGDPIPIGKPITRTTVYILDARGEPTPIGVAGELYTGGDGVARGYLGADATAEKFVPDPFARRPGGRMYRTGDRAHWRPDGTIEFHGRGDGQVKIRGFRVEVGEIEAALTQRDDLHTAAVVLRQDNPGDKRLVAYVVPAAGHRFDVDAARAQLKATLPDYMVPSAFVQLEALPLTPSGKVDRRALPAPDFHADVPYVAPEGRVERLAAEAYAAALHVPRVGALDDFLALGGHSLSAALVASRLSRALERRVAVRAIFDARTPRALAAALEGHVEAVVEPPLVAVERRALLPVTSPEARLWFVQQLDPTSVTYNECAAIRVRGRIDADALERALARLEARHEALRTRYVVVDGSPRRTIVAAGKPPLVRMTPANEDGARRALADFARVPYDLARDRLWRAAIVDIEGADPFVALAMHHIVTDEWSYHVMFRDLGALYAAERDGMPPSLAVMAVDFADFAAREAARPSKSVDADVEHFAARLRDIAALEMPADRPRPRERSFDGRKHRARLPRDLRDRIAALARDEATTPTVVMLAAWGAFAFRHTGTERFGIAMPLARRSEAELEPVVGIFVNNVVVDFDFRARPTVRDLVRRTREAALEADAHGGAPFDRVVDAVLRVRDPSRAPLAQIQFAPQPPDASYAAFGDAVAEPLAIDVGVAKLDLTLFAYDRGDAIDLELEYATALFDDETAARMASRYVALLRAALASPSAPVSELALMDAPEREAVVRMSRGANVPAPQTCLHELFEAQAAANPDAVAVEDDDRRLTYRELDARASAVAGWLTRAAVGRGSRVAIAMGRSVDMIAAVLGVLKAGAAYVPVDPKLPADRRSFMQHDAGCVAELTDATIAEAVRAAPPAARAKVSPHDLAYVLFTSGSTGRPKGVMIEHRSVVNLVHAMLREPGIARTDVALALTTLSFDVSIAEIFVALAAGAKLVVASEDAARDPALLAAVIARSSANIAGATPATWRMLTSAGWRPAPKMRIFCAGEALPRDLADVLVESGARLYNYYGPTETAIYVTGTPVDARGTITIGAPLDNTRAYILDERFEPTPIGVSGELFIAGAQVGLGYMGRASLTAERFVPDPFATSGARMYATGDVARWLPDGAIDYLGRNDHQVKVRGFRIELGEIESLLAEREDVAAATVVARDRDADKVLVAYVVPRAGVQLDLDSVRAQLSKALPAYMIPSVFVVLDAMPLTGTGKVDRNALPAPNLVGATTAYVAPRTPTETAIVEVWREVLGVERVGVHDDFFALGGHSLLAARVASRLAARLGIDVPVRAIFEEQTAERVARRLDGASGDAAQLTPIRRVDRGEPLVTSFAQERLWFLAELDPDTPTYNVPLVLRLRGRLDASALAGALTELVRRHEALRTTFLATDGRPRQIIHPPAPVPLPVEDARDEEEARKRTRDEVERPFDLVHGPLLRAKLVRIAPDDHVFVVVMHHIATDGSSVEIVERELGAAYAALRAGADAARPELPIQYADVAAWQREWVAGGALEGQLAYWKKQLAGAPTTLDLPTDRPRPPVKQWRGASVRVDLSALLPSLAELARREGTTPFVVLLAAFDVFLARHARQNDVVVGVPIAGRTRAEMENLVGFFVNTLAVRTRLDGAPTFREVVARVRGAMHEAHANQDVPFERLVEALEPPRDTSRTPVFQVMFAHLRRAERGVALEGLSIADETSLDVAKFDLDVGIEERAGSLAASFAYDVALFDSATIERFAARYAELLRAALARPDERVATLDLLGAAERRRLLVEWNATRRPASADDHDHVVRWFESQVDRTPSARAVADGHAARTYAELDERANRIAQWLRSRGVRAESVVALEIGRSVDTPAAMLGVLKAGGTYLPIDAKLPEARRTFMKQDAGALVVLDDRALAEALAFADATRPRVPIRGEGLAYVLYTSGSTGVPKGVAVCHRGLTNLLRSMQRALGVVAADRLLAITTVSFDISGLELYLPLVSGASIDIVEGATAADGALLDRTFRGREPTIVQATPATWRMLVDAGFKGDPSRLKVLCGGEALPRDLANELVDRAASVWNVYGPTETTIWSTCGRVERGDAAISIGRPIDETFVYVLDERMEPVPIGVPGELFIGGRGVARHYVGRPALTAERFVPDPFCGERGARMYATGDVVRWRRDGTLEFFGRRDAQVKIRGFRIELGEIEATLSRVAGIRQAAVVARTTAAGDHLVAYVVGAPEAAARSSLEAELRRVLPDYMIPSAFVTLDAMPLTPSGKIDRKALPAPDFAGAAAAYVAPRTPMETAIADAWGEVLGVPRVGARDDFFALGGHSLLATRAASRLGAQLGVRVPVRAIFEAPTVEALASRLAAETKTSAPSRAIRPVDPEAPVAASFEQQRLWFLDQLDPDAPTYNVVSWYRVRGPIDETALDDALSALVERHAALRTTFATVEGEPRQIVHAPERIAMRRDKASSVAEAFALARAESAKPFDLATGPLLRTTLIRIDDADHLLVIAVHHIVIDGWSLGIVERELGALYRGALRRTKVDLPRPSLAYADYAAWQRRWVAEGGIDSQLAYWRDALRGAPSSIDLPLDRARPPIKRYRGASLAVPMPKDVGARVAELALQTGASTFMVLLAAWNVMLGRTAAQAEVVVGVPMAGRGRPELEDLVGFFVNTLPIRTKLEGDPTFRDVVLRVKAAALGAIEHQDVPFERIVEDLKQPRDPSRTPVFQVMFSHLAGDGTLALDGADVVAETPRVDVSKFDLTLWLAERNRELDGVLEYDSDLFDRGTAELFAERYAALLDAALDRPDERIARMPLVTERERRRILTEWNATARDWDETPGIHGLFEETARETPDAVAVADGRAELTYRALDDRASRIARWLEQRGVSREDRVIVSLERSVDMVAAVLGVLKAGCAYVPIDPAFPADRRAYMKEDAGAVASLDASTIAEALASPPQIASRRPRGTTDLAYVLYTSGSTGKPKGVMVPHGTVVNFLRSMRREPGIVATDTLVALTTLSFDIAGLELFLPLSVGARVVIADMDTARDARALARLLESAKATIVQATPATWQMLVRDGWTPTPGLKVLCGGEAVGPELVRALLAAGVELWNMYGPTESTIWSTCSRLTNADDVTIGGPIANTRIYLLDGNGDPVPTGAVGELYIGGHGVARGYHARPELTATKFVPDPFADEPGARAYRTGDLARFRADGRIEFLGRADHQVKVHGFRIELGEIEATLARSRAVREAVVVAHEDGSGKRLVAYVVPARARGIDVDALKSEIGTTLPEYMVPRVFVQLDALPLTPNGKVDRKALPAPDQSAASAEFVAPRSDVEATLCAIFADLLGVERVGIHDDFFALGGHSLLAMQVIARVRDQLGRELTIRVFMLRPTPAQLAPEVQAAPQATTIAVRRGATPRMSFVQTLHAAWESRRPPSATWTSAYRLDLHGELDEGALRAAITAAVEEQDALRWTPTQDGRVRVIEASKVPIDVEKLSDGTDAAVDARCARACNEEPFAFDGSSLTRFLLLRRSASEHVLLATWHAFVHDPSHASLLEDRVLAFWRHLAEGAPAPKPPRVRYADFADWERRWVDADGRDGTERVRGRLRGVVPLSLAKSERTDPVMPGAIDEHAVLDEAQSARVDELASSHKTTAFTVFAALSAILLARWAGVERVPLITSVNLRELRTDFATLIGRFQNWVPLLLSVEGDPTLGDLLDRTRATIADAQAYATVPAERAFETPHVFDHPLARVVLNVPVIGGVSAPRRERVGGIETVEAPTLLRSGARNDVAIGLFSVDGHVHATLRGASDRFERTEIATRHERLRALLLDLDARKRISKLGL